MKWQDVITYPSVNLILGFRGMGKTALSYFLTELTSGYNKIDKAVFGVPFSVKKLIPKEYQIINDVGLLPSRSVVIVDEISLFAYARRSHSKINTIFDRITANSRKEKQIIFYVTHHSRKVDVNLVTDIDNLIYKKPSKLQIEMDRPAVRKFAKRAYAYLKDKDKSYSYLFSFAKDVELGLINPLPDFWSEDLSNVTSVFLEEIDKKLRNEIDTLKQQGWIIDIAEETLNKTKNN